MSERQDPKKSRSEARGELKRKRLKPNVIPHVWPNFPAYLSKDLPKARSYSVTAIAKLEKQKQVEKQQIDEALKIDHVESLEDVSQKLDRSRIPTDVHELLDSAGNLIFMSLNTSTIPKLKFSLAIQNSLSYQMASCDGVLVSNKKITHITTKSKVEYYTEIINIVLFLKDYSDTQSNPDDHYQEL